MDTATKRTNDYTATLKQYARELNFDSDLTTINGMSVAILNTVLALPRGEREKQFVKYVLECDRLQGPYRKAA